MSSKPNPKAKAKVKSNGKSKSKSEEPDTHRCFHASRRAPATSAAVSVTWHGTVRRVAKKNTGREDTSKTVQALRNILFRFWQIINNRISGLVLPCEIYTRGVWQVLSSRRSGLSLLFGIKCIWDLRTARWTYVNHREVVFMPNNQTVTVPIAQPAGARVSSAQMDALRKAGYWKCEVNLRISKTRKINTQSCSIF